jgi:hypothetical protein
MSEREKIDKEIISRVEKLEPLLEKDKLRGSEVN